MKKSEMNNPPCRGCQQRHLGCHSNCKKYLEWRDLRDDILKEKKKNLTVSDAYLDIRYSYLNKIRKKKNTPK